jgi:hypothetical protein
MSKSLAIIGACLLALAASVVFGDTIKDEPAGRTGAGLARTWTDRTGRYRVEAECVAVTEDSVVLRKSNGETVTVSLSRLSDVDRRYATSLRAERSATRKSFTIKDFGRDCFAAIVVRPRRIAGSARVALLLEDVSVAGMVSLVAPIGPKKLDQMAILLCLPGRGAAARIPYEMTRLYESTEPVTNNDEVNTVLGRLPDRIRIGHVEELSLGRKTYYQDGDYAYGSPDGRTVIEALKTRLTGLVGPRGDWSRLREKLRGFRSDHAAVVVMDMEKAPAQTIRTLADNIRFLLGKPEITDLAAEAADPVTQALRHLKTAELTGNPDGQPLARLVLANRDTASAQRLQSALEAAIHALQENFAAAAAEAEGEDGRAVLPDRLLYRALVDVSSVEREGGVVTLTVRRPDGFEELVKAAVHSAFPPPDNPR